MTRHGSKRTPIWQAIAADLRGDIAEGRYRQGEKLPTEAVLAARFGVNRHTIRHAVSALVDEGLVHTRRGSGAFVTSAPTDYPIGKRVRFHENLRAAGRAPAKTVLALETRAATAGEAKALQIAVKDPVLAYQGLSSADGQPIALAEALYPLVRLPGLEVAMAEAQGITAALSAIGVRDYTRVSTRVTAVLATATQALHLQIREGAPLIRTSSLSVDPDGRPVELGRTWFAGDKVTLTLEG
jgi:GntR family phosphonate transport system transcriptional regulator